MIEYTLHFPTPSSSEAKTLMENIYKALLYEKEQGITGYYTLPQESMLLVQELHNEQPFASFDTIALYGIGGSSLGTKAIDTALRPIRKAKEIIYFENPDPRTIQSNFAKLQNKEILHIVVSKSGNTIETLSQFKAALAHFHLNLKKDAKRIAIITDIDSNLHKFAKEVGIKSYAIPYNVGGRFSVLSAVGIIPLTLAGYDSTTILLAAKKMIERFFALQEEHILQKAYFIAHNWQRYPMNVLFSYADSLENFNKWYVQLWGESLGKIDRHANCVGPTPIAHIGAVDQHSFLQLLMQGPKDKTVTFIKVEDFGLDYPIPDIKLPYLETSNFVNGSSFATLITQECEATKDALLHKGIPVDILSLPKLDEEALGEIIVYYELLTSAVGVLLGINTYDQPGVELGKKILRERFGYVS